MSYGFLSTPSARRATNTEAVKLLLKEFLSTPSARRATECFAKHCRKALISIHALREEGDPAPKANARTIKTFLSTPSARRATSA